MKKNNINGVNPRIYPGASFAMMIAGLFLLGLGAYSNTFHAAFQFDDYSNILNAKSVSEYRNLFVLAQEQTQRFVVYFTFALNYKIGSLNPTSYHIVNWLIHSFTAVAVFVFLRMIFFIEGERRSLSETQRDNQGILWAAWGGTLFFLLHPVQTMAVTYVIQRIASLAALFYVLAVLFYVLYRRNKAPLFVSLIFALAAFFSKENTLTLPLVLIAYEACLSPHSAKEKKDAQKRNWALLSYGALIVIYTGIVFISGRTVGSVLEGAVRTAAGVGTLSARQYFLTQLTVIPHYLRLSVLPFGQNADYDWPLAQSLFELRTLAGAGVLVSFLLAGFICFARGARAAAFCIFWFFITLSVESSFIPIADVIFEHRMYLPMVGLAGLFAILLRWVVQRFGQPIMFLAVTAVVLTGLTYRRNEVWKTEYSFEQDIIKKSPKKARAYVNLANAYSNDGNQDKALELIQKAIDLNPKNTPALIFMNRGTFYQEKEMWREALDDYLKVIELDPGKGVPMREAGYCYFKLNDIPKAEEFLSKAIEFNPDDVVANFRLAEIYKGRDEFDQAQVFLSKTLDLIVAEKKDQGEIIHVGEYKLAAFWLAGIFMNQQLFEKSLQCFDMVLALDPGVAMAYQGRAISYAQLGQWDRVMEQITILRKLKQYKALEDLRKQLEPIRARSKAMIPEGVAAKDAAIT